MTEPSEFDNNTFLLARDHLNNFINRVADKYSIDNKKLLEIGPQERSEVRQAFSKCSIVTLDIVDDYNPDIIGDITEYNEHIEDSTFDIITCLEILEHTLDPFSAIKELRRICKDGGLVLFSAPLNWRIHGPIPDCWRFTEFGWNVLLKDFDILEIDKLNTPNRNLFPIKYNILARCNKQKNINMKLHKFESVS
jgi:SAM-dependent methyltransferase